MDEGFAPAFLVAVPHLADPHFRHSVVFLLEQNDEGAMGVVINRESPILVKDLCGDYQLPYHGDPESKVRFGGPVQPDHGLVMYERIDPDEDSKDLVGHWRISASQNTLGRLAAEGDPSFLCFTGYSGWGPGQLENEIKEGSWIVVPADLETANLTEPDALWANVLMSNGIDPSSLVPGGGAEA